MNREYAAAYLAAFFDGEGCVGFHVYKGSGNRRSGLGKDGYGKLSYTRSISCSNTERSLIDHVCQCLDVLGISYSVYNTGVTNVAHKEAWQVSIRGGEAGLKRFAHHIKLKSLNKAEKLKKIVESYSSIGDVKFESEDSISLREAIVIGKSDLLKWSKNKITAS